MLAEMLNTLLKTVNEGLIVPNEVTVRMSRDYSKTLQDYAERFAAYADELEEEIIEAKERAEKAKRSFEEEKAKEVAKVRAADNTGEKSNRKKFYQTGSKIFNTPSLIFIDSSGDRTENYDWLEELLRRF